MSMWLDRDLDGQPLVHPAVPQPVKRTRSVLLSPCCKAGQHGTCSKRECPCECHAPHYLPSPAPRRPTLVEGPESYAEMRTRAYLDKRMSQPCWQDWHTACHKPNCVCDCHTMQW